MVGKSAVGLIVSTAIFGCARFQPALDQKALFGGTRIPTVAQSRDGVTVSIEEFASAHKSKHAFDSDVISSGVLPLLIRIDSKSDAVFKIPPSSIRAYLDKQPLTVAKPPPSRPPRGTMSAKPWAGPF